MQVSDCEQLMRSTLRAADILGRLRGMHHVGIDGVDIDLPAWLKRAPYIELLDEHAHLDVARAFLADMLSHATKSVLFDAPVDAHVTPESEAGARAARAARSSRPEHQAIVVGGEVQMLDRLMQNYGRFISRVHPLVFVAPQGSVRPHAGLDYRLALVVHCGKRQALVSKCIAESLDRLRHLRRTHAESLGGADCPARLFLIVWRDEFNPTYGGRSASKLRTELREISEKVAHERLTIEAHNVIELQYDATVNKRVPRHTAVANRASEPGIATIADAQFPSLLLSDPQTRLHDFRLGQIIRIERHDIELGYDEIDYRIVRA